MVFFSWFQVKGSICESVDVCPMTIKTSSRRKPGPTVRHKPLDSGVRRNDGHHPSSSRRKPGPTVRHRPLDSGVRRNDGHHPSSSRRKPGSTVWHKPLDSGVRRNDGHYPSSSRRKPGSTGSPLDSRFRRSGGFCKSPFDSSFDSSQLTTDYWLRCLAARRRSMLGTGRVLRSTVSPSHSAARRARSAIVSAGICR